MKTNRIYHLTSDMVLMYYNVLGVDESEYKLNDIKLDVNKIEEISPIKLLEYDNLSTILDDNMIFLLERVCQEIYDYSYQKKYIQSVNTILKAISNLNLLEDNSNDYILLFNRLNYILNIVLSELNSFSIFKTVLLTDAIKRGSFKEIESFTNVIPNTSILLLLSMCNNKDIMDYNMYNDNDYQLKIGKVMNLIKKNKWDNTDVIFDDSLFKRLSYKKSQNMTK